MQPDIAEIARGLTPLSRDALGICCQRGSTRTNDGGLVDDLLSVMCSNVAEGVNNGWLLTWQMNPDSRRDGYINLYVPTERGLAVHSYLLSKEAL